MRTCFAIVVVTSVKIEREREREKEIQCSTLLPLQASQDLIKPEVVHAVMHPGFKREDLLRLLHFTGESACTIHFLQSTLVGRKG